MKTGVDDEEPKSVDRPTWKCYETAEKFQNLTRSNNDRCVRRSSKNGVFFLLCWFKNLAEYLTDFQKVRAHLYAYATTEFARQPVAYIIFARPGKKLLITAAFEFANRSQLV